MCFKIIATQRQLMTTNEDDKQITVYLSSIQPAMPQKYCLTIKRQVTVPPPPELFCVECRSASPRKCGSKLRDERLNQSHLKSCSIIFGWNMLIRFSLLPTQRFCCWGTAACLTDCVFSLSCILLPTFPAVGIKKKKISACTKCMLYLQYDDDNTNLSAFLL